MRLFNHQWSKKKNTNWIAYQQSYYWSINQNSEIWFINCKINCYINTNTFYCYSYIDWSFFYLFARHIFSIIARVNIYLFICSTIFSTIARIFYSLQFEINFVIYAFANQINAFFSISFETFFRFVRQHHIFLSICFVSHFYYNSKYLTKRYAFARKIDAFFSFAFKKFLNSISISISFRHHESFYFRDFYKWYDFDFFFVEIVIHIRKTINEFVNHSTLF